MRIENRVVMVHGYRYCPWAKRRKDRPQDTVFAEWRAGLTPRDTVQFGWDSIPFSIQNVYRSWRAGHPNTYSLAWSEAQRVSEFLRSTLKVQGARLPVDIICHSLGSRVVLWAMSDPNLRVRRVLILNGAEHRPEAYYACIQNPGTEFFNVFVSGDFILKSLGSWLSPEIMYAPCIGQAGLPLNPPNWTDINLDNQQIINWGKFNGMNLAGDNPGSLLDHWWTMRHKGNWKLYRGLLDQGRQFLNNLDFPYSTVS